jgi:acyl-CoA synthetase
MMPRPAPEALRRYHASGQWGTRTIAQCIAEQVALRGDKLAIKDNGGRALSYAELDAQAARLAGFFRRQGIGRGDVVTLHLPNRCEAAVVMLAAWRLGAVLHTAAPAYGRQDLAHGLARCGSKAIVVAARLRSTDYTETLHRLRSEDGIAPLALVIGQGARKVGIDFDEALAAAPLARAVAGDADDAAAVLFTSGTESQPKGVVHTHNTLLFGEHAVAAALGLDAGDRCFMASPVTHATGFMHGLVLNLTSGATLSLLDVFSGEAAVRIMAEDGATWTMGASVFLSDTLAALAQQQLRLPALRYFLCGGAPIPEDLVRRALAQGLRVLPVYGSTESPPHALLPPEAPLEDAWQTDGKPLPGIEVRVLDDQLAPVPTGQTGEAWSRGPNTFIGYLGDEETTRRTIDAALWCRSGDLAVLREDGCLKIVGRIKELVIRGGQNISVREVEDALAAHPAVHEVAVVGVAHERLGETLAAVVVPAPGHEPTLAALCEFLGARGISRFKLPEHLVLSSGLPRTPSGKIQKVLLKQQLADSRRQPPHEG